MAIQLVVRHAFSTFKIGDHITDPALVAQWSKSHPEFVIKKLLEVAPSVSSHAATSSVSPTVPTLAAIN